MLYFSWYCKVVILVLFLLIKDKPLFIMMPTALNSSVLHALLCTMEVYESLCAMLKIIALITAGDAGSSNLAANCRNLNLSCYLFGVITKLFFPLVFPEQQV